MKIIKHTYKLNGKLIKRKKTTRLILHCSATPEGKDYTVEWIDNLHKKNGWTCIGYNYVIYRDGTIHEGRPEDTVGAHTTNYNSTSIGICYIGGVATDGKTAKDTRTEEQKKALIDLVYYLMQKYPDVTVHGHREFAAKACPSFDVEKWYNEEYLPAIKYSKETFIKCNYK